MEEPETFWGHVLYGIIFGTIVAIILIILIAFTADHKVRGYYLSTEASISYTSVPRIIIDIDWQADEYIVLDRYTTYPEAIQMVDSLNATLRK